jgi:hypothetical protein
VTLLDLNDIAEKWKVSRAYARDVLTKLPEFPSPAPGSTVKKPRWLERDVKGFLGITEEEYEE